MKRNWDEFGKFKKINEYLPGTGDGDDQATQASTAICKLVYKWFNDGDVYDNRYGMAGWLNDVSGSANWLYNNLPETRPILSRIKEIGNDEDLYSAILYDVAEIVEESLDSLASKPKIGSAYDDEGPFEVNYPNEDDEY